MKTNEFQSKETGEIKPVSVSKDEALLQGLKDQMNLLTKRDIETWNRMRAAIRMHYGDYAIGLLDASGYIHEWLKASNPASV